MKRQRLLAALLAAFCILFAAAILRSHQITLLSPVDAQSSQPPAFPHLEANTKMRPAKAAERQGVVTSITAQLKAFRQNDFAKATHYQSANLQHNFPSVDFFRRMIQTGYPQFAHFKSVTFGPAQANETGQFVMISVNLTGQDGVMVKALYQMVREGKEYHVDSVVGGEPPASPLRPGVGRDI